MKVYLAGPMTGLPNYNYDTFHRYARLLRDKGIEVFNPAEAHGGDQGLELWQYYAADLPQVAAADAVALLPGWEESTGAVVEALVAQKLGKPLYSAVLLASDHTAEQSLIEKVLSVDVIDAAGYGSQSLYDDEGEFISFEENPERQRAITGGVKDNRSKSRIDLIPSAPLVGAGNVLAYGAAKYKPNNWRLGLGWSDTYASLMRHLLAFNEGEDIDPESGLPHVDHAMCQLLFLSHYYHSGDGIDDRWTSSDHDEARA